MTDSAPFTFEACPDAGACRTGMRPLLAPGMDWSEVHCGRCGKTGTIRHADLEPEAAPAIEATPEPEPAIEPDADQVEAKPSRRGEA